MLCDWTESLKEHQGKLQRYFLSWKLTLSARNSRSLDIEQVVERYEIKRMKEERAYQTMSSFRRMFSGKKPDHHLAVEYIHYVKKPMEQVRKLRAEIAHARQIMNESKPGDVISVPDEIEELLS